MKLWEDSISNSGTNTDLLEHLESANKFGQEAATQLEKLKSVSAEINKGIVPDAESVESLREQVMESLRKFENENKVVQSMMSRDPEAQEYIPVECSPAGGDRSENVDLSLLNQMYSEKFSLASNHVKPKLPDEGRRLEEKIAEQHQTIKSLESELKRVESQCSFDFRLLKSNLNEKLEDLNGFPELLHITEMKLAQCMSRNAVLEKTVQDRDNENAQLYKEVNSNKSKVESLTEKLRAVECENAQLKGRIKELEEFSLTFRQGSCTETILKTIESKLEFLKTDTASSKIQDLEEKLRLAKKHIQHLKRAKEDVTNRLTRRVEELMEALDDSRQKNHILRNQLRLIRSSYHKLFPTDDLFGLEDHPDPDDGKPLSAD
jgi:DNA repair exonuclease SbcCD ATPase subunit